jgi:hypothetical protein
MYPLPQEKKARSPGPANSWLLSYTAGSGIEAPPFGHVRHLLKFLRNTLTNGAGRCAGGLPGVCWEWHSEVMEFRWKQWWQVFDESA